MSFDLIKKILFKFDAEKVHDFTLNQFASNPFYLKKLFPSFKDHQYVRSSNLAWRNKVGLAAGFDKNAIALEFLDHLGFGAIEIGTVTPRAQLGNAKPRVFRHPKELSLRNYLGFPCKGADFVESNLKLYKPKACLGINIGKNKDTPLAHAHADYSNLVKKFEKYADYLVVNVSSPNTKDLRKLQDVSFMSEILDEVNKVRVLNKPIFVKISPDEELSDLESFLKLLIDKNIQGIIATNTTIREDWGRGGVSGEALKEKARLVQERLLELTYYVDNFDIICAGGISTKNDISDLEKKGASFFQVYTSFIYQGPQVLNNLDRKNS